MKRDRLFRAASLTGLMLAGALAISCGGGGGSSGTVTLPGLEATFTASNPSPTGQTASMEPGTQSGSTFQVRIMITDINDFFGAALNLAYDPATVTFVSATGTGSFIAGVTTRFDVTEVAAGLLDIIATREGENFAGVDAVGKQLLITLNFDATANDAANAFSFAATPRDIEICTTAGQPCSTLSAGGVTFSGGTLVVVTN